MDENGQLLHTSLVFVKKTVKEVIMSRAIIYSHFCTHRPNHKSETSKKNFMELRQPHVSILAGSSTVRHV